MNDPDSRPYLFSEASDELRGKFVGGLDQRERDEWDYVFANTAHEGQLPPPGDWRIWLIMAGRGFGKTRAGAEWVRAVAEADPAARIALVAASLGEARSVMVEGESGILACCPLDRAPAWEPSLRRLRWPHGAEATLYSAAEAEALRGPQHSHAWCDELGKWTNAHGRAEAAWNNLQLGLRLGDEQRIMVTTTPRAVPLLVKLLGDPQVVVTRGPTSANSGNLPPAFLDAMEREFAGTQLARQELEGEMIADVDGALWTRALLEACRGPAPGEELVRRVVGVDPPASDRGDECGIVVAGITAGGTVTVLADCSVAKASPERWARAVAAAARAWDADRVVAEANQGGDMVRSVLSAADIALPVKLVHASRGKAARAEPVAALYETGRVRHAGLFGVLEDQLCGLLPGGRYEGPGRSPDRADALVWAVSELAFARTARPRIRTT